MSTKSGAPGGDHRSSVETPDVGSREPAIIKFSPEEEAALLKESNDIKAEANTLFSSKDYENAVSRYNDALESCPNYLYYPRAVIQSNVAACHLMGEEWTPAVKAATSAIESLEKLERALREEKEGPASKSDTRDENGSTADSTIADAKTPKTEDDDVEEEIVSSGASRAAPNPQASPAKTPPPTATDPAHPAPSDILRIRVKSLLRRARASSHLDTWSSLSSATEDYKSLQALSSANPALLGPSDAKVVKQQLRTLPDKAKQAQEREMSEMWGKLKNLGDGILKPFGLSTDNFKMVKDEKSGGYSMNFDQNAGGGSGA